MLSWLLLGLAMGFILNIWYKDAYITSLEDIIDELERESKEAREERKLLNEQLRTLRIFHDKKR